MHEVIELLGQYGTITRQNINGGLLVYGESLSREGLSVELIIRNNAITFLSLDDVFWSDYSQAPTQQAEVRSLIECVVAGGAVAVRSRRSCLLVCGGGNSLDLHNLQLIAEWPAWDERAGVTGVVRLPIPCR